MVKDLIIRIIWFSILVSSYECLELSDISSLGQGLEPRVLESTSIQSHWDLIYIGRVTHLYTIFIYPLFIKICPQNYVSEKRKDMFLGNENWCNRV